MNESPSLADLESVLLRFFDGQWSSGQLQVLFWEELVPASDLTNRDPVLQLWYGVVVNLAFFHFCDFEREILDMSLRKLIDAVRTTGYASLTPITISQCFVDALHQRTIPAPLDPARFHSIGKTLPPVWTDEDDDRTDECGAV